MMMAICSLQKYREITRDADSYDGDIIEALQGAQRLFEFKTDRFFELRDEDGNLIERTEMVKVHQNGMAYPKATPIHSVVTPAGAQTNGRAVEASAATLETPLGYWRYPWSFWATTLTYTGGYEPEGMPEEVVRAVAELALTDIKTALTLTKIPAGATAVHVGDVSFSGKGLGSLQSIPSTVFNLILKWKRREL